jgi:hypothetical protein
MEEQSRCLRDICIFAVDDRSYGTANPALFTPGVRPRRPGFVLSVSVGDRKPFGNTTGHFSEHDSEECLPANRAVGHVQRGKAPDAIRIRCQPR